MNIAIVDDLEEEREKLKKCLDTYAQEKRLECNIRMFTSADEFMAGYRPLLYTIVFLDIYMPGRTGIEAAQEIRTMDNDTILIFLTESMDYMPEAFNCHAYDYIQKPAQQDKISKIMDELMSKNRSDERSFSFISDRENYDIPYADIVAICSSGHYLEITDKKGKTYKTRITFQQVSEELENEPRFLLVNRGILVNMDFIQKFQDGMCQLEGGIMMPANVRNSKSIEDIWHNYLFTKIRNRSMERSSLK